MTTNFFLFLQLSSTLYTKETSETTRYSPNWELRRTDLWRIRPMITNEWTDGAYLPTNTINYENDDSKNDLSTIAEEERPSSYSTNRRRRILEAIWQKRTNYPIDKQNRRRYRWRQPDDQYHIRLQLSTKRTTIERLEILSTEPDYPSRPKTLKIEYLWIHKNKRWHNDKRYDERQHDNMRSLTWRQNDERWTMDEEW